MRCLDGHCVPRSKYHILPGLRSSQVEMRLPSHRERWETFGFHEYFELARVYVEQTWAHYRTQPRYTPWHSAAHYRYRNDFARDAIIAHAAHCLRPHCSAVIIPRRGDADDDICSTATLAGHGLATANTLTTFPLYETRYRRAVHHERHVTTTFLAIPRLGSNGWTAPWRRQ